MQNAPAKQAVPDAQSLLELQDELKFGVAHR